MIIRSISDIANTDRDIRGESFRSRRLLRQQDGMEHSLHWTEIPAGASQELCYEHHFESNLCVAGEGEVVDVATGTVHPISPGTMYALDKHDRHILRAHTDLALVCVFWPALTGAERHNSAGGYDPAPPFSTGPGPTAD